MIVFVIFNGSLNRLSAETQRGFHFEQEFLIHDSSHLVMIVVLIFWLIKAVPWVLLETVNIDTFSRISHEDF